MIILGVYKRKKEELVFFLTDKLDGAPSKISGTEQIGSPQLCIGINLFLSLLTFSTTLLFSKVIFD